MFRSISFIVLFFSITISYINKYTKSL
jgi:hypothetical protein